MPTTMPTDFDSLKGMLQSVESLDAWILVSIGVGLVVAGVCLLLWGRVLHRAVLMVVAIPVGMALGSVLAERIGVAQWEWKLATALAVAVALAILTLVLARVVWAALGGLTVGAIAATIVSLYLLGSAMTEPRPEGWDPTLRDLFDAAWAVGAVQITLAFAAAGAGCLVAGLFLPRATVIAVTALLGTSLIAGSLLRLAQWLSPSLFQTVSANPGIVTGSFSALLLAGILVQSVKEIRAKRAAANGDSEAKARPAKG